MSEERGKPAGQRIDLTGEAVHWDLGTSQSYGEYLQLHAAAVRAEADLRSSTTR